MNKEGNIIGYRREGVKEGFEEIDKESKEQTEEVL